MGVIGAGGAGRSRVRSMLDTYRDKIRIVATADPNEDNIVRLEKIAGKIPENRKYTTREGFRQMIEDGDLDAVGIFSPHSLHYEHLMHSLGAKLHVLIEKPFVTGVGDAIRSYRLAEKNDLALVVCYQRHFQPQYSFGRELIACKRLGDVIGFYVYMAQDWGVKGTWRWNPKFSRGQPDDSGSHYQDILLWMTGLLPAAAEGTVDYWYHGDIAPVPINSNTKVTLSNGAKGRLIIIGDYYRGFTDDVRIEMTEGLMTFERGKIDVARRDGTAYSVGDFHLPNNYPESPEDNFVGLLTGRYQENYVPGIFGARVSLLADAILRAGETGKEVICEELVEAAGYSMNDLR